MVNAEYGFYEEDEELIAVLGKGYLQSFLSGQGIQKGSLILTDKRVYFKGKRYERTVGGYKSYYGESNINVHDCVASNRRKVGSSWIISLGTLSIFLGLAGDIIYSGMSWRGDFFGWVFVGLFIFLLLLIIYFLTRKNLFYIEYPGGAIGTNCGWFSGHEINEFQKALAIQILREKERING
jgi:hypothetical protein